MLTRLTLTLRVVMSSPLLAGPGASVAGGGPLGDGPLEGKIVTCPWHGWQYDVTTGKVMQNPSVGVACYRVEVRAGEVFVDLGA